MNGFNKNLHLNYNLNIRENKLTIPRKDIKNVELIISAIIEKTNLSELDVYDLDLIILND